MRLVPKAIVVSVSLLSQRLLLRIYPFNEHDAVCHELFRTARDTRPAALHP